MGEHITRGHICGPAYGGHGRPGGSVGSSAKLRHDELAADEVRVVVRESKGSMVVFQDFALEDVRLRVGTEPRVVGLGELCERGVSQGEQLGRGVTLHGHGAGDGVVRQGIAMRGGRAWRRGFIRARVAASPRDASTPA